MSRTALNWSVLVEEAIRRRKAEGLSQRSLAALAGVSVPTVNAFERGATTLRFERAIAILSVLGLFESPPAPDSLDAYVAEARKAADTASARWPQGSAEFAFAVKGDGTRRPSTAQLRDLAVSLAADTRFPLIGAGEVGAPIMGEAWVEYAQASGGSNSDHYWRVGQGGQGFARIPLPEDGPASLKPGTLFDVTFPILYLASFLGFAARFARAIGGDEASGVQVQLLYAGIEGRTLLSWADPLLRLDAGGVARSAEVALKTDTLVGQIEGELVSVITGLLAPLYERFDGYSLSRDFVAAQLGETARREGSSIGPFTITKEMIKGLGDEALRSLLGKLVEAEAAARGISASAIDLGGNQTAPDGGIDASIRWEDGISPSGWLPRRTIYFQCKSTVMRPADIVMEMRPGGVVRPIFAELAAHDGAYLIVSTDDVGTKAADARHAAMRAALEGLPSAERIYLDFLGADRIARWTNQHIGITLWTLTQAGRPLLGWRPFGAWSTSDSSGLPYLIDESARAAIDGNMGSIRTAMTAMRAALDTPGGCVRLVGISGMGKTRLAEALFDARINAGNALRTSLALYADAGHDLATSPAAIAEQVTLQGVEAVLVVDNCTAKTHRQLTEIVRREGSRTSLITIDYDAGDEQPAGTMIVRLDANADDLVRELITQRFPALTESECARLAEFSGGNARIAVGIARNSRDGIDLATLNDEELLDRLFQAGRGQADRGTRRAADAAALVWAFYAEEGRDHAPEYPVLAEQAGMANEPFFEHVSTLLDWGVIQQRGPQRAVMPPPLANRLARTLVRRADPQAMLERFANGPPRLFASFARRLGQLHDEPRAVELTGKMMAVGGSLGDLAAMDARQRAIFAAVAPANPVSALVAIERAVRDAAFVADEDAAVEVAQILAHIAYDPNVFVRAMTAMLPLALVEDHIKRGDAVRDCFLERFWPGLSWTMADGPIRFAFIDSLLNNPNDTVQLLGLEALDHMLDAWHLSSSFMPEWGARSRAKEWRPRGPTYVQWLTEAYRRIEAIVAAGGVGAERARAIVASHLREQISTGGVSLILSAMRAVGPSSYWDEGWRAASEALHFTPKTENVAWWNDLAALEMDLRPKTIEQCFEAFVLGEPWRHWHPSGRPEASARNIAMLAKAVGVRLARSGAMLDTYLQRAVTATGQNSTLAFGEGLARVAIDLDQLWGAAYSNYEQAAPATRDAGVLVGIVLCGDKRDRPWGNAKLDSIASNPNLSAFLVYFHGGRNLDADDVVRFIDALDAGTVTPERLGALMMGGRTKPIPAAALARLLARMAAHDRGIIPALETLHMRIYGDRQDKRAIAPELVEFARVLLVDPRTYGEESQRTDHELAALAPFVLEGPEGKATAVAICRAMRQAADAKDHWSERNFGEVAKFLMQRFARVVLDEIVGKQVGRNGRNLAATAFGGSVASDIDGSTPATKFDSDIILAWVTEDPGARTDQLARLIPYADAASEGAQLTWTRMARGLIDAAPDPQPVLERFEERFFTGVSSGPFSSRFVRRKPMVEEMRDHHDRRVRTWAEAALQRLDREAGYWDERDREERSLFE